MVIYLERGADLHMAQRMPLPLTVSCFSKIQTGFTFLVPAHPGSPERRVTIVGLCVCLYVQYNRASAYLSCRLEAGESFSQLLRQLVAMATNTSHANTYTDTAVRATSQLEKRCL